jgi:hypothetical protein
MRENESKRKKREEMCRERGKEITATEKIYRETGLNFAYFQGLE